MNYSKKEIIDLIFPAVWKASNETPEAIRSRLERLSYAELESMLEKQKRAGLILPQQPHTTPRVTQEDVERAKQQGAQEQAQARQEAAARLAEIEAERYADNLAFRDAQYRADAPKRAAELAEDKNTFLKVAKTLRLFGTTEANFSLLRSTLGPGFDVYQVEQSVISGAVSLSPPSQDELDQWAQEDVEIRNEFLRQADVHVLKKIANDEHQQNIQTSAAKANDDAFKAQQQRDSYFGFPPLPNEWNGVPLDAKFIRSTDVLTIKLLNKKYGSSQVTARLQGRG
jgi:hypothetical protein